MFPKKIYWKAISYISYTLIFSEIGFNLIAHNFPTNILKLLFDPVLAFGRCSK